MEWSTESIEKVINCFVQERPFFISCVVSRTCMNLHENLMQETCARNLCKFRAQFSWLCVTTISLQVAAERADRACVRIQVRYLLSSGVWLSSSALVPWTVAVRRRR